MSVSTYSPPSTKIVHKTKVDFISRTSPPQPIHIVQYDTELPILEAHLYSDNIPYTIPTNANVKLRLSKRDNTFVEAIALGCNSARNIAYFQITHQMTIFADELYPVVEVAIGSGVAASSPIHLIIDNNPIQNGMQESTTEWQSIQAAMDKVDKINELATDIVSMKSNIEASEQNAKKYAEDAEASKKSAKEYSDNASKCLEDCKSISEDVASMKDEVSEDLDDAAEFLGAMREIKTQNEAIDADIKQISETVKTYSETAKDCKEACESIKTAVETSQNDVSTAVEAISTIKGSIDELYENVTGTKTSIDSIYADINATKEIVQNVGEEVSEDLETIQNLYDAFMVSDAKKYADEAAESAKTALEESSKITDAIKAANDASEAAKKAIDDFNNMMLLGNLDFSEDWG